MNKAFACGILGGIGYLGFIFIGMPKIMKTWDTYSIIRTQKCLSKNYVTVSDLERHMIENCKNGGLCKVRLDTCNHKEKAKEITENHFKHNYYVSTEHCYECNKYMEFMFIRKIA